MGCLFRNRHKRPLWLSFVLLVWSKLETGWQGSVLESVGLSSLTKSLLGSDQLPLLYHMETSPDNVRRLLTLNCYLLFFKVYSKTEKLWCSGKGSKRYPKYKTSNPHSVKQWHRSYYFYHVFLHLRF